MNPYPSDPSMPASEAEIAQELKVLISSMPQQRGVDGKDVVVAYVAVLKGFTLEEIDRGIIAFLLGEVAEDISRKYCPTPPQLVSIIRTVNAYSLAKREREMREAREVKQIAGPKWEPPSEEAKARVQAQYEEFCRQHAEQIKNRRRNRDEIYERSNIRWDNCKWI